MPGQTTSDTPLAIVIPAGGGGTRLWPRSRKAAPKQFLDIVEPGRSMLQMTVDRVVPSLVEPSAVFVIASRAHVPLVREQLPAVPAHNVVGEPVGRDSAPAIGLMAAILEARLGPDVVMVVLSADHAIRDVPRFRQILRDGAAAAADGALVTVGITATSPNTGFGYIHRGEQIGDPHEPTDGAPVYRVREFREKPDPVTAQGYVDSGEYYWNAGMYIAKVGALRKLFRTHLPEAEAHFAELVAVLGSAQEETTFARIYPQLPRISVDFAIAEKADRVAVVPADIGWSDVGSWSGLAEVLAHRQDHHGNIALGDSQRFMDCRDCMVFAPGKMVAVIGLNDVIVVDAGDALLVASKDRAGEVKTLVESLQAEGRLDLL